MISAAPNPQARLIMLEQWRAGLRVSEALALETRDLHLDTEHPTLRVRQGKGRKAWVVPVHPELQAAFIAATSFGAVGQGRLIDVTRTTAWRWVQQAVQRYRGRPTHARPSRWDTHDQAQLCAPFAAKRNPDRQPQQVAGPFQHSDHVDLPGAASRPCRQPGCSTVVRQFCTASTGGE